MIKRQEESRLLGPSKSTNSSWDSSWAYQNQRQNFDSLLLGGGWLCVPCCLLPSTATPQVKNLSLAQAVLPQEGRSSSGKACGVEHEEQPNVP